MRLKYYSVMHGKLSRTFCHSFGYIDRKWIVISDMLGVKRSEAMDNTVLFRLVSLLFVSVIVLCILFHLTFLPFMLSESFTFPNIIHRAEQGEETEYQQTDNKDHF